MESNYLKIFIRSVLDVVGFCLGVFLVFFLTMVLLYYIALRVSHIPWIQEQINPPKVHKI